VTTFPVEITVARLVEFRGTIEAICLAEVGRLPSWGKEDDPMAEIMELMAFHGSTGEQLQAWLHASEEAKHFRGEL
jgi:hypothetical protein